MCSQPGPLPHAQPGPFIITVLWFRLQGLYISFIGVKGCHYGHAGGPGNFRATQETVFRRSTSIGSNLGHVVKDAARPSAVRVQGLGLVEAFRV